MPQPPPSQRFRLAQQCLLSPLSTVPLGTALSPATARRMLRDRLSWELLCAPGVGLRMLAGVWGGQRGFFWEGMTTGWGMLSSHSSQQWESPPVLLFESGNLPAPVPQGQDGAQDGACCCQVSK